MKLPKLLLFATLFFLLTALNGRLYGQSQASATAQPATASAPSPQAQAAPLPNAKPAKVWTNDEIDTLRNDHGVSVVGKNQPTQNVSTKTTVHSPDKDPAWYRKQLEPLQEEIAKLDGQIAKLQAFLNGENVSDPATMHRRMVPTPQDQLTQLQAKRAKDVEKVNDLLDRARHNDIPPGELR